MIGVLSIWIVCVCRLLLVYICNVEHATLIFLQSLAVRCSLFNKRYVSLRLNLLHVR